MKKGDLIVNENQNGLMHKYFSYNGWDFFGPGEIAHYEVKLKVDIGPVKAGTTFDIANVSFQTGTISFYNNNNPRQSEIIVTFELMFG